MESCAHLPDDRHRLYIPMNRMDRRDFLRLVSLAGLSPVLSQRSFAQDYQGDLVLSVNAFGAWDVSSFCDPKLIG